MESVSYANSYFNPRQNAHNNIVNNLDNHLHSIIKIDENEKKLLDFLNSKLEAMEKIDLDDECFVEGETEIKNVNLEKNLIRKSKHSKSEKSYNSPNKKKNKRNQSRKKSENKSNNQNMIIKHNGKIEKYKMESNELSDVINLDIDKEVKKKELNQFFSNQNLLNSIINLMNDE